MNQSTESVFHLGEFPKSFPLMIGITVLSITSVYLYSVISDFLQTFLERPAHFLPFKISQVVKPTKVDVPLVELKEGGDYRELLARGSEQYPDRPFKLRHPPGEIVILPFKYMDMIKNAPESKLSFQQGSFDMLMGQHTGITAHDLEMATVIRRDVGRLLDRVHTIVDDEAIDAMKQEIGPCDDWTEVLLLPKAVRMIVKVSQRVFVGEPLCRDERWIQTITNSTAASFGSVNKLWAGNWMTRPFIAWRDPGLSAMRKYKKSSYDLIGPVLDQRLKNLQDPDFKAPPDLMQLVIDGWKDGKGRTLDHQVHTQFGTGRAALFTTGITVYYLIYDLATHPEYIEPLREEVVGLGGAPMTRANVAKLTKLDSFIRECQRWSKFFLVGTLRKVIQPLKLDDGTVLPVGTLLAVDAHNAVFNKSLLEDPYKFDGFRFERLRAQEGNSMKYQAATTGPDHLVFGHGTQACPGRFFAIHEIKVALARILLNYDFKLKDKPVHSPMARVAGVVTNADPSVKFLFKSRK